MGASAPSAASRKEREARAGLSYNKKWTAEEDALLLQCVSSHGLKWKLIATEIAGRSHIAIKEHYRLIERIEPRALVFETYTAEEDALILKGISSFGFKWNKIATKMAGRTGEAVRQRYTRYLAYKVGAGSITSPLSDGGTTPHSELPPSGGPHDGSFDHADELLAAACGGDGLDGEGASACIAASGKEREVRAGLSANETWG